MNNKGHIIHPILIKKNLYLLSQEGKEGMSYWVVAVFPKGSVLIGSVSESFTDDFFEMLTSIHPNIQLDAWILLGEPSNRENQWMQLQAHQQEPVIVLSKHQASSLPKSLESNKVNFIEDLMIDPALPWPLSFISFSCSSQPSTYLVYLHESNALISQGVFVTESLFSSLLNSERWMNEMAKYMTKKISDCQAYDGLFQLIKHKSIDALITLDGQIMFSDRIRQLLTFFEQYHQKQIQKAMRPSLYHPHLLKLISKLKDHFGIEAVLNTFENTPFLIIENVDHSIDVRVHNDYDWQAFFEIIFLNQGVQWLEVIQNEVTAICLELKIPLPWIFDPFFYKMIQKQSMEKQEKKVLEEKITSLELELRTTIDQVTKDALTQTYNETFMKEFLKREINLRSNDFLQKDFCLIYINIDDFVRINAKYSKEIGDETIVHLGYILNQMAKNQAMVFKRFAPGFIFYSELTTESPMELAKRIQNQVRSSDLFIEPITVSLAMVQLSECSITTSTDAIINQLMSLGENRIKAGATKGKETLIDSSTKLTKLYNAKLLIIDDEPINSALLKTLFYNQNYEVVIATDAISAMNQLKNVMFDAIICERNLPKKDGFAIKVALNDQAMNAKTLFILLTYQKTKDLVIRANQVEIDYVIQKPVIFEELLGFIQRQLKRRQTP